MLKETLFHLLLLFMLLFLFFTYFILLPIEPLIHLYPRMLLSHLLLLPLIYSIIWLSLLCFVCFIFFMLILKNILFLRTKLLLFASNITFCLIKFSRLAIFMFTRPVFSPFFITSSFLFLFVKYFLFIFGGLTWLIIVTSFISLICTETSRKPKQYFVVRSY